MHATFTAHGSSVTLSLSWTLPYHGELGLWRFVAFGTLARRSRRWAPRQLSEWQDAVIHPCGGESAGHGILPLLIPNPFRRPSPRQPILGITPGVCFLGNPAADGMRWTPAPRIDHLEEHTRRYFVPADCLVEREGDTFHRFSWE